MTPANGQARATLVDDVQLVKNLIYSYAELLDGGDFEALGRLFAAATLRTDGASVVLEGADAVRQLIEGSVHLYDGVPGTKHLITNAVVAIGDGGTATARSYYTAMQARPELPLQPILAGRWHDRFAKSNGCWRFADRMIYTDLVGDLRFHIKGMGG